MGERERLAGGGDVVHPEEARATPPCERAGNGGRAVPVLDRLPGDGAEESFPGGTDQHRPAERLERRELVEEQDILLHGLGEAEAGSTAIGLGRHAGRGRAATAARSSSRTPPTTPPSYSAWVYDAISRTAPRECMSTTPASASAATRRYPGIEPERRHVVHDRGARAERRSRDLGLHRVDRDDAVGWRRDERFHDGYDPAQLLFGRHRLGPAGPGGFAADVHDVGARGHQASACASAASRPVNRPPSLKLSGVTLRMPMRTGRSSATGPGPCASWRRVGGRARPTDRGLGQGFGRPSRGGRKR